ncbi:MAG: S46 family peptidase [bacterium]|nr:S46 family peptidase [bacterium]
MTSLPLHGVAGKWTPEQLLEHDPAWLKELGLELSAEELWDLEKGGLLEAIIKIGGCSAGLLSEDGLVITNHHCIFGILQEHSTPERDLIASGFLAAGREDELPGTGTRATVPYSFTDVTAEVAGAVPEDADDLERYRAIDRKTKELVAECEQREFRRCHVAAYDDGVQYQLVEALEFPDVRLVYAPPRTVGEFGGEVDNWMWPRHSGDFALVRVYAGGENQPVAHAADNQPYRPRRHLRISPEGARPGSFVLVAGYPGITYRSLVAAEMGERAERFFPGRAHLYREWLDVMEAAGERDEEARILLADRVKSLANREKNARGQVAGIERGRLLAKKHESEREVLAWAAEQENHGATVAAYEELGKLVEEQSATWDRDFLLENVGGGPMALDLALRITRWAMEQAKPDLERHLDYQDRHREKQLDGHRRDQKRLHPDTEATLLVDYLGRLAALSDGQRLPAVTALLDDARDAEQIGPFVDHLFTGSSILDLDARLAMFDESVDELRKRDDPMIDFAFELNAEILAIEERAHRFDGAVSRLRPVWRRAVRAYLDRPLDPDANRTLRVSLAHVEGYRPRDGILMEPRTKLAGIVEKHTGEDPFDAPAPVLAAAAGAPESRWADADLGDVPVCFLATGDTTGGSSGSPVLDARGRLVGVNFDRVWENVANDFGYNPEIARNVSADVRYLLWMLEAIEMPGSKALLEELGVGIPEE